MRPPVGHGRASGSLRSMPKDEDEVVEVRCPECDAKVRVSQKQAEQTYLAKCPNGHEVPLVKAI